MRRSARSPGYVLNVLSDDSWIAEYRSSSTKSLYTVNVEKMWSRGLVFGQCVWCGGLTDRACVAIYKMFGQLLFAMTVVIPA